MLWQMCVYDRYARGQKSEFDVETFCEQASVDVFGVVDFTAIAISDMVLRKTSFQVTFVTIVSESMWKTRCRLLGHIIQPISKSNGKKNAFPILSTTAWVTPTGEPSSRVTFILIIILPNDCPYTLSMNVQ